MKPRVELLHALLTLTLPSTEVLPELSTYGWDSATPLVTLMRNQVVAVLEKYLQHQMSAIEVEDWANAIEGRDDIAYDSDEIAEIIDSLANPLLSTPLSEAQAKQWLEELMSPLQP